MPMIAIIISLHIKKQGKSGKDAFSEREGEK